MSVAGEQSEVEVRPARPEDAPRANELLAELDYPYSTNEEVAARITHWSERDDLVVLTAERKGDVVGIVALAVIPHFERHGCWGRIVAIVVDSQVRNLRIGRRLVKTAEDEARARGCISMEVSSARRRTDAQSFYRTLGYTDWCDRGARFLKDLVPGASDHTYANR